MSKSNLYSDSEAVMGNIDELVRNIAGHYTCSNYIATDRILK